MIAPRAKPLCRHSVAVALFALLGCARPETAPRAASAEQRPNILLLLADDLRRDAVGAFGGTEFFTPSLDALAANGTALTQIACMGSRHGAVCAPSRAMLMTGRGLPHVADDMADATTLPEVLRRSGYATWMTGKWHNGDASLQRAFPDAKAVFRGGMASHFAVPLDDVDGGRIHNARIGDRHSSELFANAAIDYLRERGHERGAAPFFAYVAFTAPHDPRDPPPAWRERLADRPPPALPANFRGQHGLDLGPETMTVRDEMLLGWPRDPALLQRQRTEYRALVAHLDEQIGRILAALDEAGLADHTLVVFASDHGLALGSHGLLGKQSLYDHSMGSPVLLRGPGVPRGATRDGLGYLFDLATTIANAAGTALPEADGIDLMPMIRGEGRGRTELYLAYASTQRAIRTDHHELIRFPNIDRSLVFDLRADPSELHNLSADPANASLLAELATRLREAQQRWGDTLPWTAANVRPATIDLSGHARQPDQWQPRWIVETYFR